MNAEFPGVPECSNSFGFTGEVFVAAVVHVALIHEGWKLDP